ncbi:hypothetical protein NPIL_535261 [Nephila pilipes]|uniref:Uncharacterized protein n=1 Tax=Nephila pilipes TaxID=299642 RepID=A0A8X6PHA2_NEPPI|nr:hypothetical protein NPIL_535261 [Nephila pilipes]
MKGPINFSPVNQKLSVVSDLLSRETLNKQTQSTYCKVSTKNKDDKQRRKNEKGYHRRRRRIYQILPSKKPTLKNEKPSYAAFELNLSPPYSISEEKKDFSLFHLLQEKDGDQTKRIL